MLRGVQFFDRSIHQSGVQAVLENNTRGNVYVVDTFVSPAIQNGLDLRRALAHSMGLAEWYSYEVPVLIAQALLSPAPIHILVLVVSPNHQHLLDRSLLQGLSEAHEVASKNGQAFWTFVFENPIAARASSL